MYLRNANIVTFFVDLYYRNGIDDFLERVNVCRPFITGNRHMLIVANVEENQERVVSREEIYRYADEFNCKYMEYCVRTGEGMDDI